MKSRRIPGYLLHKATGQARVVIDVITYWLGAHGAPNSHNRYDDLVSQLVS